MSKRLITWVAVLSWASLCPAQEPSHEQLKKLYDDALKQLEMSQQRKNELARENEALKEENDRLAAWKKDAEKRLEDLKELEARARAWATRTYLLRMEQAAWRELLARDSKLKAKWDAFVNAAALDLPQALPVVWEDPPPTTQPQTRPTTRPQASSTPAPP